MEAVTQVEKGIECMLLKVIMFQYTQILLM